VRAALAELREAALAEIAAAENDEALAAVRQKYLGRKGSLSAILRGLGQLPPEERPAMGALANEVTALVTQALEKGFLINVTLDNVVRLVPPLVLSVEQAGLLVDALVPLITAFLDRQNVPQSDAQSA